MYTMIGWGIMNTAGGGGTAGWRGKLDDCVGVDFAEEQT